MRGDYWLLRGAGYCVYFSSVKGVFWEWLLVLLGVNGDTQASATGGGVCVGVCLILLAFLTLVVVTAL